MDNCLEKKIYDRQINKQGMADRVVDECNPDAHLSIKEVTNLCWDNEQDTEPRDFSTEKDKYIDVVMQKLLQKFGTRLSKVCWLLSIITHITCFWHTYMWFPVYDYWKCIR
jgi:RAD54-like protein 2